MRDENACSTQHSIFVFNTLEHVFCRHLAVTMFARSLFLHSMSAFASIFRNMYNGAFSIEWFVSFEIPNRNRLNFPFHWDILQSICGFVTQKKVMITNYSLHRKRKSRCWHLHGNAVVCNAKQYNQYMKIIRKLPISGSLYFTCRLNVSIACFWAWMAFCPKISCSSHLFE